MSLIKLKSAFHSVKRNNISELTKIGNNVTELIKDINEDTTEKVIMKNRTTNKINLRCGIRHTDML